MQTQSIPTMTGTAGNMPGGGAAKMKMSNPVESTKSSERKVHEIYTTTKSEETGTVDAAKAAALKAKPGRPAPLKRKTQIKLTKEQAKIVKDLRKASKEKFQERSQQVKKEIVYRRNAVSRSAKRVKCAIKAKKLPERKMNNCTIMYSVGPQPKSTDASSKFRQFRKFQAAQLKCAKKQQPGSEISYMYKVGMHPVALVSK